MVRAVHMRLGGHRHVAIDTCDVGIGRMVRVSEDIFHALFVARQAGFIGFVFKAESAAGGVAMNAFKFLGTRAGIGHPASLRIVFSQVTSVGKEVGIFVGDQVVVVE